MKSQYAKWYQCKGILANMKLCNKFIRPNVAAAMVQLNSVFYTTNYNLDLILVIIHFGVFFFVGIGYYMWLISPGPYLYTTVFDQFGIELKIILVHLYMTFSFFLASLHQ